MAEVLTTGVVDAVWADVDTKGPTACCSLRGWTWLQRATARVWDFPLLIHTASICDGAEFRQFVMMPVIVRLCVASDTLVGRRPPMRGIVRSLRRVRALPRAFRRCWACRAWVSTPAWLGLLLGRSAAWVRVGCGRSPPVAHVYRVVMGGLFRLYGVPFAVSALSNDNLRGCEFVHLGGVGKVARDGDLGRVVLARGGLRKDVVGCQLVMWGLHLCVQFESGVERLCCWGFFLASCVRRHFGVHQVSRDPGFWAPHLGGCCCCGSKEDGGVEV